MKIDLHRLLRSRLYVVAVSERNPACWPCNESHPISHLALLAFPSTQEGLTTLSEHLKLGTVVHLDRSQENRNRENLCTLERITKQSFGITKQTKCSWRNLLRSRAYPALSYEIFVRMFFLRRGTTQTCPLPGSPPQEVCLCVCGNGTRIRFYLLHSIKQSLCEEYYVVYGEGILNRVLNTVRSLRSWNPQQYCGSGRPSPLLACHSRR